MRYGGLPAFGSDVYRAEPIGPFRATPSAPLPADMSGLWRAFVRRRMTVAVVFGLTMLLGVAYIWITPPTYLATAEILIDPRKRDIIEKEIVQSGLGTSALGPDTFLLDSQIEVMLSQSVLRGLIARTNLLTDPEFVGTAPSSFSAGVSDYVKLLLRGPQAEHIGRMSDYERALAVLLKRLDIKRKGNTYVFAVSMRSQDPAKAAEIANTLVKDYIEEINRTSRDRVSDASHLLDKRLDELRRNLAASRQKVETYRRTNGLISTEKLTVIEQQLRDLNLQLARVAITANSARSRWDEVSKLQQMTPDSALASGLLESPTLSTLRDRAAALTVEEGSLTQQLADRHPALTALRESRAALERSIRSEVRRLIARSKYEYEVASAEEASLRARIAKLEAATANSNKANVTLQELVREAEANAAIYDQFLARSKSAREQMNVPNETVGLISEAFPPTRPVWPAEPLILGCAAVVGLLLGLLAAIVRQARGRRAPAPTQPPNALVFSHASHHERVWRSF